MKQPSQNVADGKRQHKALMRLLFGELVMVVLSLVGVWLLIGWAETKEVESQALFGGMWITCCIVVYWSSSTIFRLFFETRAKKNTAKGEDLGGSGDSLVHPSSF